MNLLLVCIIIIINLIVFCGGAPVGDAHKQPDSQKRATQDTEYYRYLSKVFNELQQDPEFKKILENTTFDDLKTDNIIDRMDLIGFKVRKQLDEVKRAEIEYQRDLIRQRKFHMLEKENNDWNPIHLANTKTFEKEDLKKLVEKHRKFADEMDNQRRKVFKDYEMKKEHERRKKAKKMDATQNDGRAKEMDGNKTKKQHERMHEPGHRAMLQETWEKEDHLDPDNFDERTLFKLHDKNGDNYLDAYELKTLFLTEIDKVYNESDPGTDLMERNEEMERMREHMMRHEDLDKDGMISLHEFLASQNDTSYEKDEEWKPIIDQEQYTDEEMNAYDKQHPYDDELDEGHGAGIPDERHNEGHVQRAEHPVQVQIQIPTQDEKAE